MYLHMCIGDVHLGCDRLRNLDLDFENPKTDFNAEISVFGFSFLRFDWEIRKRIWKTVLKNSSLARTRILSKKKTTVHENSFENPFSDFPIERLKGNPWNLDLDFLIEIHPEDGFLGGEIRFRISRSIGKSGLRFWKSKSGFPNRTHPYMYLHSGGPLYLFKIQLYVVLVVNDWIFLI